jgi:hypothetical protein
MKFKYIYFFPLIANGALKIEKSFETAETLRRRVEHEPTNLSDVEYLIKVNKVGFFVELGTGELVIQQD